MAVVNKKDENNEEAMKMAECIIANGREELLKTYPIPLYEGEKVDDANKSGNPKAFPEKLSVKLLEKHQALSEAVSYTHLDVYKRQELIRESQPSRWISRFMA